MTKDNISGSSSFVTHSQSKCKPLQMEIGDRMEISETDGHCKVLHLYLWWLLVTIKIEPDCISMVVLNDSCSAL